MFFTKLSLLLLYYRLFSANRVTKYLVIFGMTYNFTLYTIWVCLTLLLCRASSLNTHCIRDLNIFVLIASSLNILSDLFTLLIPILPVLRLQLASRQKAGVLTVFCAGFL